ncbi:MAG: glycosyltransferase family 39 protein [Dehalococcoidales bacterium]|nr:glycosyltransferase family 39 protein [Dehalococcoidales bacterium]
MAVCSIVDWAKHHRTALLLAGILLVSIFLRFYDLGAESVWLDEAESIKESALSIQKIAEHSNQPPLYFLLLRGWIHLFGTNEIALRSLSAIFGVLAVLLVFLTGRALFNPRVGLIGAFLVSLAYFPVAYSQEARAYSLLLMLSLLSMWTFVEILRTGKYWTYPAYFASGFLLIYTHFYGLFIILSQVLFFLLFYKKYKDQRWKFLYSAGPLLISVIPLILLLKNRISVIYTHGFWIPRPGVGELFSTISNFYAMGPGRIAIPVIICLLAIAGLFIIARMEKKPLRVKARKHQRDKPVWQIHFESPERTVLLLLWLGLPVLIPFIESQIMTPVYQSKYAIGALPALCLLSANGLNNIRWTWVFYPVLIVIVVLSAIGLHSYYINDIKDQWREVAGLIDAEAGVEDVIVVCEEYHRVPLNYYYKGNLRREGINSLQDAKKFVDSETGSMSGKEGRLWLVLVYNKQPVLEYFIDSYGQSSIDLARRYTGITVVRMDIAASDLNKVER